VYSTFSCYLHVGSVFTVHSRRILSFPVRVRWWHRDVCNVCIVLDRSASCCLRAKLPGLTVGVCRVWSLPRMFGASQPARAWLHYTMYMCVCVTELSCECDGWCLKPVMFPLCWLFVVQWNLSCWYCCIAHTMAFTSLIELHSTVEGDFQNQFLLFFCCLAVAHKDQLCRKCWCSGNMMSLLCSVYFEREPSGRSAALRFWITGDKWRCISVYCLPCVGCQVCGFSFFVGLDWSICWLEEEATEPGSH